MHQDQLRTLIRSVLGKVGLYSEAAEELLLLTAAVESHLGKYIYQIGGPARGIFQMEPATEHDIWENFLAYRPKLADDVRRLMCSGTCDDLAHNLEYQVAMARIHYLRVPETLPIPAEIRSMARYWKLYYNTTLGKGTVDKAVDAYKEFIHG